MMVAPIEVAMARKHDLAKPSSLFLQ